jgi:hypothetical protein
MVTTAATKGALAGLAGAAVMTVTELVEQRLTGRPDSYVPGRTLSALVGRRVPETSRPTAVNLAMHFGTAAVLGSLRGVWSEIGLRGPGWSAAHTVVRLSTDQTLENSTGVGAPPHTWASQERVIDTLHKAVYSFATGFVSDRIIPARPRPLPGRHSH